MPESTTSGMPPELEPLYRRLLADGAAWSADLPSTARLRAQLHHLATADREEPGETVAWPSHASQTSWEARRQPTSPRYAPSPSFPPRAHQGMQSGPSHARTGGLLAVVAAVVVVALLAGTLVALRGRTGGPAVSTHPESSPTSTGVAATQAPVQATPPRAPLAGQLAAGVCPNLPRSLPLYRVGDVVFTQPAMPEHAYYKLPDGVAHVPQQVAGTNSENPSPTNPDMGSGLVIYACNTDATQAHTISAAALRVETFAPYAGQVDEWNSCDGVYDTATAQIGASGCGGGMTIDEGLQVTLPANVAAGTTLTATQVSSGKDSDPSSPFGPLPVSLESGATMELNVGVNGSIPPGTYTFSLGMSVDGGAATFAPGAGKPTLFAPIAHKWNGQACTQQSMRAQIPTPSDGKSTYYVCPAS